MNKILTILLAIAGLASAHHQVIYSPKIETTAKTAELRFVFTHPFSCHVVMKTGRDKNNKALGMKEVFYIHKGKKVDITKSLKPITFKLPKASGPAFSAQLNGKNGFKSAGDYIVVAVPYPYNEPAEDNYIQQITKFMINRGGFETDWKNRVIEGYTEIIPLTDPYSINTGGLFRARVVDNNGNPVKNATVEVEFLNYNVNVSKNSTVGKAISENEKLGTDIVITDENGIFEFIPQIAGYWGFSVLNSGNETEYDGKELEQDAVIWIKALPVK